jgi:hypothetical protein
MRFAIAEAKRLDGKQIRLEDLKVTVTYWGGRQGPVEAETICS